MKKILIIGSKDVGTKNDPVMIAEKMNLSDLEATVVYWEDLLFDISTGVVKIFANDKNIFDDKPDLVIALGWYKNGKKAIYRDVAYSLALFLQHNGIKFWNSEMVCQRSTTKLSCMVQLALEDIPIPHTYFSLDIKNSTNLSLPFVAKAAGASRGKLNFLIKEGDDLNKIYNMDAYFLIQSYLPNDHDLRVICFNGIPNLILKRARKQDSATHLNNTSQGGIATWLELSDIKPELLTLSEKICKVTGREMAGIDFIPDVLSSFGYSCLEVNAIPQLTSGTDSNKKLTALIDVLCNI